MEYLELKLKKKDILPEIIFQKDLKVANLNNLWLRTSH